MKTLPDLITRWDEVTQIYEYDLFIQFVKRKPELWMFVPCGKDGLPLKKPNKKDYVCEEGLYAYIDINELKEAKKQYQKAEARCLFSGNWVKIDYHSEYEVWIINEDDCFRVNITNWTIEDLCNKVELTPEGEKEAGI